MTVNEFEDNVSYLFTTDILYADMTTLEIITDNIDKNSNISRIDIDTVNHAIVLYI